MVLRWHSLHGLYASLIGKATLVIGLASPIVQLSALGIEFPNYSFYLAGSILIIFGFILEKIFLPPIIADFASTKAYTNYLLGLEEKDAFDYRFEFKQIDDFKDKYELLKLANLDKSLADHFPINNAKNLLGVKKFVYFAGSLNYVIANCSLKWVRVFCTLLFFMGVFSIYAPSLRSIIKYSGVS